MQNEFLRDVCLAIGDMHLVGHPKIMIREISQSQNIRQRQMASNMAQDTLPASLAHAATAFEHMCARAAGDAARASDEPVATTRG